MKRNGDRMYWSLLAGLLLLSGVAEGLKGTALVISKLKQKNGDTTTPIAESRSSEDAPEGHGSTDGAGESVPLSAAGAEAGNATTKSPLTGIPQIDYVHDPNLPRELNGYNLTEYPFYDRVPDEIDFKCDGLHDGFYASIPHKCQVYHHCLFGTRYDFLCANYTAFDQKTFICHFVSEVDCINSPKYFKRNEALYKQASTTVATTTTAATQPPLPAPTRRPQPAAGPAPGRRRRPYRRRRPAYDYYYDYEEDPDYYYDDELPAQRSTTSAPPLPPAGGRRRKRPRPQRPIEDDRRPQRPLEDDRRPQRPLEDDRRVPVSGPSAPAIPLEHTDSQPEADLRPRPSSSVYDRPRVPPKIRRPVPANERDKYDYTTRKPGVSAEEPIKPKPADQPADTAGDYYDYEEDYIPPARNPQSGSPRAKKPEYYPPTASEDRDIVRRPTMTGAGRPLRRNRPTTGSARRRPETVTPYAPLPLEDEADDYDEPYEQDQRRPIRPGTGLRKKQPPPVRQEDNLRPIPQQPARQEPGYTQPQRSYPRGQSSQYGTEDVADEPVPAPRPAYISTAPGGPAARPMYRKRVQQQPESEEHLPSRSAIPESTGYRRPTGQRRPPAAARQPAYQDEHTPEDDYYYDEEIPEEAPQDNYRNRQKPPPRGTGVRVQPVNPLPPPPPPPPPPVKSTDIEDDEIITPPQRPSNGKRPFLPSRGGNPTLPRGLQPVGAKAVQQTSIVGSTNSNDDRFGRTPQFQTSNSQPKLEVPAELPLKESSIPKTPALTDALTSRPLPQNSFRSGESRVPQLDRFEDDHQPSRVPASNTEYRSKIAEDVQPRIPPSAGGNFRNKQAIGGDGFIRNYNGKYQPSLPETNQGTPPSSAIGLSSTTYRTKAEDLSLANAKTSAPLLNIRDDGFRQQQQKTSAVTNEDFKPIPPPTGYGKQPSVAVYRTPVKIPSKSSGIPETRIPDLPAKTNLADIDESEYDVTLNDALHPTLHPTRSVATGIVSFPQQQAVQRVQVFKTKIGSPLSPSLSPSSSLSSSQRGAEGYSNDASSSSTGGRGYLVASASQRQVTRAPYTSLSVQTKDSTLVEVEAGPREYLHQQDDSVQQTRKRRPTTQYDDVVSPSRYIQTDQYQRNTGSHDGLPLSIPDETSVTSNYGRQRQRQRPNWKQDPNVDYVSQY